VIVETVFVCICFVFLWLVPHPVVSLTNFLIHGMHYVMLFHVMSCHVRVYSGNSDPYKETVITVVDFMRHWGLWSENSNVTFPLVNVHQQVFPLWFQSLALALLVYITTGRRPSQHLGTESHKFKCKIVSPKYWYVNMVANSTL
jgi:hypothetical protein